MSNATAQAPVATATPLKSTATIFAVMGGLDKAPSLPFGTYDFILNDAGDDVYLDTATSAKGNDYQFVYVVPSGMDPKDAATPRRRVYPSALSAPSATAILYDKTTGGLKRTFSAGIYQDEKRASIVSSNAAQVAKGIADGSERYRAEKKAKEDAEKAAELANG